MVGFEGRGTGGPGLCSATAFDGCVCSGNTGEGRAPIQYRYIKLQYIVFYRPSGKQSPRSECVNLIIGQVSLNELCYVRSSCILAV